jgi:colanic acid/amylovoran biosynthesis glycosyltransferase
MTEPAPDGEYVYLVSRFPKVTETFIINEIIELQRLGARVRILSLLPTDEDITQPAARPLLEQVSFAPRSPLALLAAQWFWLRKRPGDLARTWSSVLRQNRSSPALFAKSVVTTLTASHWARELGGVRVHRLHAHWATHPTLAAWVISQLTDTRFSFTTHAHDLYGENPMLRAKAAASDFVVTISDFNVTVLRTRCAPDEPRVHVIHCGIDRSRFTVEPARPGPLAVFRLLCVGGLVDYKGHTYLLDACAELVAEGRSIELLLVGDGPLREELTAHAARRGLADVVTFAGRRTSDDVQRHLRECDAVVLPSAPAPKGMMEGIPVALMEALAVGRPVISTLVSGIPELVTDGQQGLLVPPADPAALAVAIRTLIANDELRIRLGAAGPEKVAAGFDLQQNTAALFDLLKT